MLYFEKSGVEPASLAVEREKPSGKYNLADVLEQLKRDFKNKCYICELKNPTSINVEHFVPHKDADVNLKFGWSNLFYACYHCNNLKSDKFIDLLNCTTDEGIEGKLRYEVQVMPHGKVKVDVVDASREAENTRELVLAAYNGTTSLKKLEGANIREVLIQDVRQFTNLLFDFYAADDNDLNDEDKAALKLGIQRHISKSAGFASFKRLVIRENELFMSDFGEFL